MSKKKVGFASGIGFILAAAGSAVGLGNLWGFPYKTAKNILSNNLYTTQHKKQSRAAAMQ